jgi:Acetyltransferase (GNAT) domain
MSSYRAPETTRLFRTQAWGNAWLDVWGKDPRLTLIDLGGRGNPREMLYGVKSKIKKILPIRSLHLIGVGCGVISTPRAEYNDLSDLVNMDDFKNMLSSEHHLIPWDQFFLPDLVLASPSHKTFQEWVAQKGLGVHELRTEPAYYVSAQDFDAYTASLGANTRLAYFNRRERLQQIGEIDFLQFSTDKSMEFFALINQFHLARWGRPCYSIDSQYFLKNFIERLVAEKGSSVLEAMRVNGEIVSVLFDVVLDGCRYNFQSGYLENKYPKVALGAIHMGYAIEAAIKSGSIYDFMAGEGKNSNYKARIATHQEMIKSVVVERGTIKYLRKLKKSLHYFSSTHSEG